MYIRSSLVLLMVFVSFIGCSKKEPKTNALSPSELLITLFKAKSFDDEGRGIWKPTSAERKQFNTYDDGLCHTSVDTIMMFNGVDGKEAVVIFYTWPLADCHACSPDMSIALFASASDDGPWTYKRMNKNIGRWGAWGNSAKVQLWHIGDNNRYALDIEDGYMGQGIMNEGLYLYSLDDFKEIFTLQTHEDNSGNTEEESELYNWDKKVTVIHSAGTSGYYDLQVATSGKGVATGDDNNSKIVELSGTDRYHYDDNAKRYVLVK